MPFQRKTTVAHLITGLLVGGAERQLLYTLPCLNDFEHVVICLKQWGPIGDALRAAGIPVYFVSTPHLFSRKSVQECLNIFSKHSPDLVITYLPFADLFGRIWRKKLHIPRLVCFLHSTMREWRYAPLVFLNIWTQRFVDFFFAVSDSVKVAYEKKGLPKGKTKVIHNGVDLAAFSNPPASLPNARLDALKGPLLGYVAKLRKERGHRLLFRVMRRLKDKEVTASLLLIGDGPYQPTLQRLVEKMGIEDRVLFLGNRSDVPQLLQRLTLYVHPSLYEGMSVALIEAMAAGCTIVTTDIPENREVAGPSPAMVLSPVQDAQALTAHITTLLQDEPQRAAYAQKAKERSLFFSLDKTLQQLEAAYLEVLEGSANISRNPSLRP